ncbi:NACHT domain-containing protein [Micromonospora sp. NPDC047465]|uniref:NACHT domain-containing protein n=1 Tax=Micromonospora sp. NPDC047465 TaxID=3154813 RepID=UPI0033DEF602
MFADVGRVLGPVLNLVVKALVQPPQQGAGTVKEPVRLDSRVKLPGKQLERSLSPKHIDALVEQLSRRFESVRLRDFTVLSESDWNPAVAAVGATLKSLGPIGVADAIQLNLSHQNLVDRALQADPDRPQRELLSGAGTVVYHRLLDDSCRHVIEFITQRPEFRQRVDVELIRRTAALQESADAALERAHLRPEDRDFERRYSDLVLRKLDSLQLFGVTLNKNEAYPLSTAYLSLSAAQESGRRKPRASSRLDLAASQRLRVHDALADTSRVLIRGEAGSGKTTLLQWLAINLVKEEGQLPGGWTPAVPFFIPLRRYALRDLPTPERFTKEIAPALSGEAPDKWVQRVMRSGRAVVLIDGVDELPAAKRNEIWKWLHDLVVSYEDARYVITSRPPAADATIVVPDEFKTFLLLPMGSADVRTFVRQWHSALASTKREGTEPDRLKQYELDLLDKLAQRRDLRRLATNPLLCALTCALHIDRYRQLPRDRIGLYQAALEMLLVRRDEAKEIAGDGVLLSQKDQEMLLAQLAYWLVRNGRSDVDREEALRRLRKYLAAMSHVTAKPSQVLDYLLLRSGVLREPVKGRIDFLHKTFQEYLAAQAILDEGDIDYLTKHAHEDSWREVVVMAVGHGRRDEREKIIRSLITSDNELDPEDSNRKILVAAACLEHPGALDPDLAATVKRLVRRLVPPKTAIAAEQLAEAGDIVLDLVPDPSTLSDDEGLYLLQLINRFHPEDTLPVLARIAASPRPAIRRKLAAFWPQVPPDEYARSVLALMELSDVAVVARGEDQLHSLQHLDGLRRLIVDGHRGDLHSISRAALLERAAFVSCQLEGFDAGALRDLKVLDLCDTTIEGGLQAAAKPSIQELSLLGNAVVRDIEFADEFSRLFSLFPNLSKLTVDWSLVASTSPQAVANGRNLRSLTLLSSPTFARFLDGVYKTFAPRARQPIGWRRPSMHQFAGLTSIEEVTLVGWPSRGELLMMQKLPSLTTLRVIAVRDDLRRKIHSDGGIYPYPGLQTGLQESLLNLRNLHTLDLILFDSLGPIFDLQESFDVADLAWLPPYLSRVTRPKSLVEVTLNGNLPR